MCHSTVDKNCKTSADLLARVFSLSSLFIQATWLKAYSCLQQRPLGLVARIGRATHINSHIRELFGTASVYHWPLSFSITTAGMLKCSFNAISILLLIFIFTHLPLVNSSLSRLAQCPHFPLPSFTKSVIVEFYTQCIKNVLAQVSHHSITAVFPLGCDVDLYPWSVMTKDLCRCDVTLPVCFILTSNAVHSCSSMSWQLQQQLG